MANKKNKYIIFNVFTAIFVDVPRGCCLTVSVRNTSEIPVDV